MNIEAIRVLIARAGSPLLFLASLKKSSKSFDNIEKRCKPKLLQGNLMFSQLESIYAYILKKQRKP